MGKYTVLGHPIATCTRRVLMALEEKGATYEMKYINVLGEEHKSPEYLEKHHPFGQIPVLYDDEFRLYESRAMARYVADVIPGGPDIFPKDPKQRALVEQFLSVESSNYKPAETLVSELVFKKKRGLQSDQAVVEEASKKLHDFLVVFNKLIGETNNYLVGNEFTLADLVFMPYTEYLLTTEQFANVFSEYPNVARWWKTISSRPAWQKVLSLK